MFFLRQSKLETLKRTQHPKPFKATFSSEMLGLDIAVVIAMYSSLIRYIKPYALKFSLDV